MAVIVNNELTAKASRDAPNFAEEHNGAQNEGTEED
jgi:hypothetical protein